MNLENHKTAIYEKQIDNIFQIHNCGVYVHTTKAQCIQQQQNTVIAESHFNFHCPISSASVEVASPVQRPNPSSPWRTSPCH